MNLVRKDIAKKLFVIVLLGVMALSILSGSIQASQQQTPPITVILDGEVLAFDVPPIIMDDRTMVPMRVIFEALGADIDWNATMRTVTAIRDEVTIQTTIGEKNLSVNGVNHTMDVAPIILDGRTLVPVRFISEALDAGVLWDGATRTVTIVTLNREIPLTGMRFVTTGRSFSFAIDAYGGLWAWGNNEAGQLGDGTATTREPSPNPYVLDHFIGEIIDNNNRTRPVKIMDDVVYITASFQYAMAIRTDGSLWAWGFGILGNGETRTLSYYPIKIMDDVIHVSAGFGHTMAITSDGSLWVWGGNVEGQLGIGTSGHTRYNKYTPVKIMENVIYASAGFSHSMAITADGNLWAWGWNSLGQLGNGMRGFRYNQNTPIKIMDNVASVSASYYHTMAIRTDGSLWGWGANWSGEIGDGTIDTRIWDEEEGFWYFRNRPTPIKIMESVASASVAQRHTMAITTDGNLWAWGYGYGASPRKIMDSVSMVSTGLHTIVLRTDGSVWGFGRNDSGQVGDGTTRDRSSPVEIISATR